MTLLSLNGMLWQNFNKSTVVHAKMGYVVPKHALFGVRFVIHLAGPDICAQNLTTLAAISEI